LVNIRGTNGAGKSTIPKSMLERDKMYRVIGLGEDGKAPYITVFPSYLWVALGTYFNNTGGLDTYKNNDETKKALNYVLKNFPEYDILMEGIIASTIKSTYVNWFKRAESLMEREIITQRKIIIMNFIPPLDICLERVQHRNGFKPVNVKQIESKWNTVNRNVQYFQDKGFTSIKIDTSKCPREKMLINFIKTCEKYSGGRR
jgi:hypothetical protein